jgi:hypothetical protein
MSESTKKPDPASSPDSVDRARRRLLAMSIYVPPTVLGIISLQQAGCQPGPSCNPASCNPNTQPCQPDNNPCAPDTGCNPDSCPPNA